MTKTLRPGVILGCVLKRTVFQALWNIMVEKLEIWGVYDPNISAQLALAAKLDLFKREANLDVSCHFIESGTTMSADILNAERKPFAFTQTPITSILLHEQGFSTKLLAPLADIAGTQQVVVQEAAKIGAPKDLEGKRVGMAQEAAVYIAVKNMARDCDVDLNKVQFAHLLPHEQLKAFQEGELDAMACWEPWTARARMSGGKFYFSGNRSEIPGMEGDVNWLINQSCVIVPDDYLKSHPKQVIAMLNVLRKSTDLINRHRKEVIKELAEFFGITRVELMMTMRKNKYAMGLDTIFRLGVLGLRDFFYENGRVSSRFKEDTLYDTSYLKEVDPSLMLLENVDSQNIKIIGRTGIYYREDVALYGDGLRLQFLLADDSRFVRTALTRVVNIIGGEVIGEATNGNEAIEMFTSLRPNFVTMDLSMPGMSGVDAIKRIRQIDPDVNMIVISGVDLEEVREEVFDLGAKIFITKPFDPLQVAEIIGLLLL